MNVQISLKYLFKTYTSCKYSNCHVLWYQIFPLRPTPLVMIGINLPYHYTYINSYPVPKCYSCSICERTTRRATLLTASNGREWNILISYGHWSDCGKGFELVCTAKKGLKVKTTEGRKGETLSVVIPTIVRIYFRCFSIKDTNITSWEATSSRAFKKFTNSTESKFSLWC
jgi:hypothetical protein